MVAALTIMAICREMSEDVQRRPETSQLNVMRGGPIAHGLRKALQMRDFYGGVGARGVFSAACAYSVLLSLGRWGTFGS
jgi:hypothetical protein